MHWVLQGEWIIFTASNHAPIVHRDLSSNNILLASDHAVKIADLGVAKCVNASPCSPMPGTNVYMPPKVLQYSVLSVAIDLFSYEVFTDTARDETVSKSRKNDGGNFSRPRE